MEICGRKIIQKFNETKPKMGVYLLLTAIRYLDPMVETLIRKIGKNR
jgi:hypothetical protein